MKVAVVGSRNINVDIEKFIPEGVTEIVSGGAAGIDFLAEKHADENNIPKKIFLPEYEKFGRRAPLLRNIQIVDYADMVVAIWDGKSKGTGFTVNYAKKVGKPLKIYMQN